MRKPVSGVQLIAALTEHFSKYQTQKNGVVVEIRNNGLTLLYTPTEVVHRDGHTILVLERTEV